MTSLPVGSLIYYRTQGERSSADWMAFNIRKIIKGEEASGYFHVTVGGVVKRFDKTNQADFLPPLLGQLARDFRRVVPGPITLVPIPNSNALVGAKDRFRTQEFAEQTARFMGDGAKAVAALRWRQPRNPAHISNDRDPQIHYDNLKVVEKVPGPVVIFDDMITSGSQIIASCRRLREAGATVSRALVVCRVTHEAKDPVVGWVEESLEIDSQPVSWPGF